MTSPAVLDQKSTGMRTTATQRGVIVPGQIVDIADPKLKAIGKRIIRGLQLEAERAVAHRAAPEAFPLAAQQLRSSDETLFLSWFDRLDATKQQAAKARAMASVNKTESARTDFYGDLARVDLRSAISVFAQAQALPIPEDIMTTVDYLNTLTELDGQILTPCPLMPATDEPEEMPEASFSPVTNKLELRIHKVKCLDETDPEFFNDDEISMGGTTIDQSGVTREVSAFLVRDDFDSGESKTYTPPKRFASFDLTAGGTKFPKGYFATVVLAETDMGGFGAFLDMLWAKTKGQVLALVTSAVGAAIGTAIPVPLLGTIVGAVAGYVVGVVIGYLISLFGDDVFKPVTLSLSIPSLSHRFAGGLTDSPNSIIMFEGYGGKYQVTVDWRMFS